MPNGYQRLDCVKTRALWIRFRIQESEQSSAAPLHTKEQEVQDRGRGHGGIAKVLGIHAREVEHQGRHAGAHQRSAEIGLFHNEQNEEQAGQSRGD